MRSGNLFENVPQHCIDICVVACSYIHYTRCLALSLRGVYSGQEWEWCLFLTCRAACGCVWGHRGVSAQAGPSQCPGCRAAATTTEKLAGHFTGQMSCNYSLLASPLAACQSSQWRERPPTSEWENYSLDTFDIYLHLIVRERSVAPWGTCKSSQASNFSLSVADRQLMSDIINFKYVFKLPLNVVAELYFHHEVLGSLFLFEEMSLLESFRGPCSC